MRCVIARFSYEQRQTAYFVYMSEAAKILTENTTRQSGGSKLTRSYHEIIGMGKRDERTGDEIAADIITRAGLVVK